MVINLKQLYEMTGREEPFEGQVSPERLDEVHGFSFVGPVTLRGTVRNRAGVVMIGYNAALTVSALCDRCLSGIERGFSFDFEHVLVRSVNGENDDYVVTADDELDMDELAMDDILLEMPTKLLCREDCRGLCPSCGADLNISDCDCETDA